MIGRGEKTLGNSISEQQVASLRGALGTSRIHRKCHNGYSKVWVNGPPGGRRDDSTLRKMLQLALFWTFCSIFCKASFFVAQAWYLGTKVHSWLRWMLLLKLQYLRSSIRGTPLYPRTNFRSLISEVIAGALEQFRIFYCRFMIYIASKTLNYTLTAPTSCSSDAGKILPNSVEIWRISFDNWRLTMTVTRQ